MVQLQPHSPTDIIYPESDGKPMADNTKQFRWIVTIKENLEWLFAQDPQVFIAGDLLWYPVEGDNKTTQAPDVMVVFGRPKGDRGSYQQWREENIPPQVVFEILSPSNTRAEMNRKLLFYDRYGVEEFYQYDPDKQILRGWLRRDSFLDVIEAIDQWVSPRLQIRFDLSQTELCIYHPDNELFLTPSEIAARAEQAKERAEQAEQRAEQAEDRAEQAKERAEQAEERAQRLTAQLKALGIDPDSM
jgi:Uma2 family endonuclease